MTSIGMSYVMLGTPNEGSNCAYTATALEAFFGRTIITATNQPLYQLDPSYLAQFNAGAGTVTATVLAEPNGTTPLVDPSGRTARPSLPDRRRQWACSARSPRKSPRAGTWHIRARPAAGGRSAAEQGGDWGPSHVEGFSLLRFAATKSRPEQIGRRISRRSDVMTGVGDERAENARIQT